MPEIKQVDSNAVIAYAIMGLLIGLASVIVTKTIYLIEDAFEKLPVHWMWWPAIGGIGVGVIGTFAPTTLGVGYENITNALSGQLTITILISLCFWKFISWSIALGSGTSGGTLAPLLTIGSSFGCLLGIIGQRYFPEAHISLPLAALVGMAALFTGSTRAILTSIVFAMETTMQESTLLPLLAGCVTSYMVSFILMQTTIMTEKIKRRGVMLPDSYVPDILENKIVSDFLVPHNEGNIPMISESLTVQELRSWFVNEGLQYKYNTLFIVDNDQQLVGTLNRKSFFESVSEKHMPINTIMIPGIHSVYSDNLLQLAVEFMLRTNQDILPVIDRTTYKITGFINEHEVLKAFEQRFHEESNIHRHISMKAKTLSMVRKSKNLFSKR